MKKVVTGFMLLAVGFIVGALLFSGSIKNLGYEISWRDHNEDEFEIIVDLGKGYEFDAYDVQVLDRTAILKLSKKALTD